MKCYHFYPSHCKKWFSSSCFFRTNINIFLNHKESQNALKNIMCGGLTNETGKTCGSLFFFIYFSENRLILCLKWMYSQINVFFWEAKLHTNYPAAKHWCERDDQSVFLVFYRVAIKSLFGSRASVPPLCRGLGGVEGGSQRSLERSGTVRKTLSGGMAALRRHSHCISVKLQAVRKQGH